MPPEFMDAAHRTRDELDLDAEGQYLLCEARKSS